MPSLYILGPSPFAHLQADLEAKYLVIFQNYGLDLDAVQKIYEKFKASPPVPRNAPPVAGNIMWARQLLRRIELPMKRCGYNVVALWHMIISNAAHVKWHSRDRTALCIS